MSDQLDPAHGAWMNYHALPRLYHFVYCSLAADGVDEREVLRLVAAAQRHNLAGNITGMLAFANGVFFQWIEGPRSQIEKLIASLNRDKRHHHLVTLSQAEEVRARLYPDWDMQHVDASYIRKVLHDALASNDDADNIAALNRILAHLDARPFESLGRG